MIRSVLPCTSAVLLAVIASSCRMTGVEQVGRHPSPRHLPERITLLNLNAQKGQDEGLPQALDRVFYRSLRFESAEVLDVDISDHKAFLATFTLGEA